MKHKVKLTVIDKKLYPELQKEYCADENAGACPCYNVGDEFIFEREDGKDDFWAMGINTLVKTNADKNTIAGGPLKPHCSEAWDAISRYIYAGLQGGYSNRRLRSSRPSYFDCRLSKRKYSYEMATKWNKRIIVTI